MRKKSLALLVAVASVLTLVAAPVSAQSASTLRDELLKDWLDMQTPTIDRAARTKADVLRAMNASFDYGAAVIRSQTEASLFEVVPTNAFLGPSSRARVLYFLLGHSWDVYGQLVVYVRLNGGVPPASDRP